MPNFAYFDQFEQKINVLLTEKKYRDAFNLCKEILLKYPEEKRFIKIKEKIEEAVSEENERIIKEKLEGLNPLWKEEKYSQILRTLKELLQVDPNSLKMKKLYQEAEILYRKQFEKFQEDFNKKQNRRLTDLLDNNPLILMEELYILERENPNNESVKKLVADFRDKLIAKKIREKEELLNSTKYDVIENFIQELIKIDKGNGRIQELEKQIKKRKFSTETDQTKEFVYSGEKHLDTLMKLKKYDKAIKVANEILTIDKNNIPVKRMLEKAKEKYSGQLRDLAAASILDHFQELKTRYSQDKSCFIKL